MGEYFLLTLDPVGTLVGKNAGAVVEELEKVLDAKMRLDGHVVMRPGPWLAVESPRLDF